MTIQKQIEFALACYNDNTISELSAALQCAADETDMRKWNITEHECRAAILSAYDEKMADLDESDNSKLLNQAATVLTTNEYLNYETIVDVYQQRAILESSILRVLRQKARDLLQIFVEKLGYNYCDYSPDELLDDEYRSFIRRAITLVHGCYEIDMSAVKDQVSREVDKYERIDSERQKYVDSDFF